ncbi:MAG: acylphosphatase [Lacrimispora sp.]
MDHGKNRVITKRIRVYGIVQGVGFRPLVYHIAGQLGIKGTVRNVGGYVEIMAQSGRRFWMNF